MGITQVWDAGKPVSGDLVSQGPAEFQTHWAALTERLRRGGHRWETSASIDAEAGRHYCGGEFDFDNALGTAGEWYVYRRNRTTKFATFKDQEHANPGLILENSLGANPTIIEAQKLRALTHGLEITAGGLTVTAGSVALPNDSIQQAEIQNEAATKADTATATAVNLIGTVEEDVVTLAYTTAAIAGKVLILASGQYVSNSGSANGTSRLYRDAVLLHEFDITSTSITDYQHVSHLFLATGLANSTAFTFKVRAISPGGDLNASDFVLAVVELRR